MLHKFSKHIFCVFRYKWVDIYTNKTHGKKVILKSCWYIFGYSPKVKGWIGRCKKSYPCKSMK